MADGGYLVPPLAGEKGSEIWIETWKRVDRFLPDLFAEIFPKMHHPSATATVVQNVEELSMPPTESRKETGDEPPTAIEPPKIDRREHSSPDVSQEQALT